MTTRTKAQDKKMIKSYSLVDVCPYDIANAYDEMDLDVKLKDKDFIEITKNLQSGYSPEYDLDTAIEEEINNYIEEKENTN